MTLLVISLLSLILCRSFGDKNIRWELSVILRFFFIGTVGAGASSSFIVSDSTNGHWEVDIPQCFPGVDRRPDKRPWSPIGPKVCRHSDRPLLRSDPSVLKVLTESARLWDLKQLIFYLFCDADIGNSIDFLSIDIKGLSIIKIRQKNILRNGIFCRKIMKLQFIRNYL